MFCPNMNRVRRAFLRINSRVCAIDLYSELIKDLLINISHENSLEISPREDTGSFRLVIPYPLTTRDEIFHDIHRIAIAPHCGAALFIRRVIFPGVTYGAAAAAQRRKEGEGEVEASRKGRER